MVEMNDALRTPGGGTDDDQLCFSDRFTKRIGCEVEDGMNCALDLAYIQRVRFLSRRVNEIEESETGEVNEQGSENEADAPGPRHSEAKCQSPRFNLATIAGSSPLLWVYVRLHFYPSSPPIQ